MPIQLPDPILLRCAALINLGTMMNLFSINMFIHVIDVKNRLNANRLLIQDLQDIQRLGAVVCENTEINDLLRTDIKELSEILELFITVAYSPVRPCGMWSNVSMI